MRCIKCGITDVRLSLGTLQRARKIRSIGCIVGRSVERELEVIVFVDHLTRVRIDVVNELAEGVSRNEAGFPGQICLVIVVIDNTLGNGSLAQLLFGVQRLKCPSL